MQGKAPRLPWPSSLYHSGKRTAEGRSRVFTLSQNGYGADTKLGRSQPQLSPGYGLPQGKKSWQHPKDFPSGPPPQYYPGPATVNFGVLKRSGVFVAVWPPAIGTCSGRLRPKVGPQVGKNKRTLPDAARSKELFLGISNYFPTCGKGIRFS